MTRIWRTRTSIRRVRNAQLIIRLGWSMIEEEERRLGLARPGWSWRVPNFVSARAFVR